MNKPIFLMMLTLSILMTACSSKMPFQPSPVIIKNTGNSEDSNAMADAACKADAACDVASDVLDDQRYGGVQQQYVVKGCKVTIYNDGPIQMVNEKTDQPCDAPIRKDHQFSKSSQTYQKNGCTITEYKSAAGGQDAIMDCSKK